MKEDFDQQDIPTGVTLEPCPLCASDAQIWKRTTVTRSGDTQIHPFVCCSHGEPIGPQFNDITSGCPMFMPPEDFYRMRIADAVKQWNSFAKAATALQRKNRWSRAKVLRDGLPAEEGDKE